MAYGRGIYVKQNGQWVEVQQPAVNADGYWANITKGFVRQGGQWKQFFPSTGGEVRATPGTYYFTVPPGIRELTVTVIGAGGGGGGSTEVGNGAGGGGGGGGGYRTEIMQVYPGQVITAHVGAGGAGAPYVGRDPGSSGAEGPGGDGGDSWIGGNPAGIVATGGKGGGPGVGNAGGGGGGGCCVVATALTNAGTWSPEEKVNLIKWCESTLHDTTLGETFRRGYQVIGSKIIVPHLFNGGQSATSKYVAWSFKNATNMLRGLEFNWLSLPNSALWLTAMMLTGAVVSKRYARRSWINLYRKNK